MFPPHAGHGLINVCCSLGNEWYQHSSFILVFIITMQSSMNYNKTLKMIAKRKELRLEQVQEIRSIEQGGQGQQLMLPVVVTVCLAPHEQCTGEYIDTTHSFRLQCYCECHLNKMISNKVVG